MYLCWVHYLFTSCWTSLKTIRVFIFNLRAGSNQWEAQFSVSTTGCLKPANYIYCHYWADSRRWKAAWKHMKSNKWCCCCCCCKRHFGLNNRRGGEDRSKKSCNIKQSFIMGSVSLNLPPGFLERSLVFSLSTSISALQSRGAESQWGYWCESGGELVEANTFSSRGRRDQN